MIETIIRYIIIAIVLGVIGEAISHFSSKTIDEDISTTHYRVKALAVLKYACMSQFILGMVMFLVFSYFYLQGNETVEMGHLYVSSIFGAIGLYGLAWASVWGVKVDDSQLEIHRIFHTKKVLCITDIGQVIIDKKDAMILYDKTGKKLIKIDALSDNYDYLLDSLKLNNIKILNKHL
ncbi:hypothetical protein ACQRC2_02365 [Catenibacterium mitsuokai]|uniref:hypothetical protein n=1 Tax=Catenibacterium mitsuokai TaxID=100886 RepID=UPI00242DB004|nr:hypothetical protein [Catenibacterium mitsuokai]MDD6596627.1 hypothetical protein [Catenibacterium mitsuokai]